MTQANGASPSELQSNPVFTHKPSTLFSSSIAQSDINELLARGIPALSPPTGGNKVNSFNHNYDVNGDDFKNGWGRGPTSSYGTRWLHSDMKDMAYPYTHVLYDTMVSEGDLQ